MKGKADKDFTRGSMGKAIIRMALPLMVAQLVNVLYSIVDRMYIGHIPEVGSMALTGLGLTMPVISIISAFSSLVGTGGGPLCSIFRGSGEKEKAELVMGNGLTLLLIMGVVMTVVIEIFMEPILYLFGASEVTYTYAYQYASIYVMGSVFVMLSLGMNYFINAQGFARTGMITVLCGAAVNIVLDPVFIFALKMGIKGAAVATVIAQLCSAAWAMHFLLSDRAILELKAKNMVLRGKMVWRILSLGTTGFVMSVTNGLVQIAENNQLKTFGGDLYVGAMTVINSVREVVFMMLHGLTQGCQPVIGYNYGAGANQRVRAGIRFVTLTSTLYGIVVWAIVMLIPGALTRIFNNSAELVAVCAPSMQIYFCGFLFMPLQLTGQCIFVGLGKTKYAIVFSLLRKVGIVVVLIYILPACTPLGVDGVFWSEPISCLLGGLACYITMYFTVYKPLGESKGERLSNF